MVDCQFCSVEVYEKIIEIRYLKFAN